MKDIIWQDIQVSSCGTFHRLNDRPLYPQRYLQVMKYHAPGLAPVKHALGAFHIDIQGLPAYTARFKETFGFYEGLATVRTDQGWSHITPQGQAAYPGYFLWCGNFQEGCCPVKDAMGLYFHINTVGASLYPQRYAYVGDFKDGYAVICNSNGLHTHIDTQGNYLHQQWFIDLDVFHKGAARAKSMEGWYHIDIQGQALYTERYAMIEPFYNGVARVEDFEGRLLTLNTQGEIIAELRPSQTHWAQLSRDMVGFWRTETIATALTLQVFNHFPGRTEEIASALQIKPPYLERLLRALWELHLIEPIHARWQLTEKGRLLSPQPHAFLAAAGIMWSDVNTQHWKQLPDLIRAAADQAHPLFKAHASDEKLKYYHQATDGYADQDWMLLKTHLSCEKHEKLIGIGRGSKRLLEHLLEENAHQSATLLCEGYALKHLKVDPPIAARYHTQEHAISHPWPIKADAIFLPKVLLHWPDRDAIQILNQARDALMPLGKIYIFETVLDPHHPNGGLLDLNLLAESGGQLRSLTDWEKIFSACQLRLEQHLNLSSWLNLLIIHATP
jgi:hypothetical protein